MTAILSSLIKVHPHKALDQSPIPALDAPGAEFPRLVVKMRQRTPIGGLMLEAVEGWRFSVRDGTIAGRRGEQPGVLRVTSHGPNELERPIRHESCLKLAAKFAKVPDSLLRQQQAVASVSPFGWGSARWGKDYVCAWYCCRPSGLIIGVYAFPIALFHEQEQQFALNECAHMIANAIFDRTLWGADDELTRFLIAQQEAQQRLHLSDT